VTTGGCIAHSHQCEICAFLAFVSVGRPSIGEIATGHQAIGETALVEQLTYFSSLLGWHTPRGPPSLT
jgi:hypothetical protein